MFFKSPDLEKAQWKDDGENFTFKVDGKNLTEKVLYDYCGNSLLVYYPPKRAVFILRSFDDLRNNEWHEAVYLNLDNDMYCFHDEDSVSIWFRGENVSNQVEIAIIDRKLLIYHAEEQSVYIIEELSPVEEEDYLPCDLLSDDAIGFYEKLEGNQYRLFYKGCELSDGFPGEMVGNSALLYHCEQNSYYLFRNFGEVETGEVRPVETLFIDVDPIWCYDGEELYFFKEGEDIEDELNGSMVDEDYLLYHEASNTTYLLENFQARESDDDDFYPAKILSTSANIFWRVKNNKVSIFYLGEQILSRDDDVQVSGDDLVVDSNKIGAVFLLKNYKNMEEGVLHPLA